MLTQTMVTGTMQYESLMLPKSVLGLPCIRRVEEEEEEEEEIEIGQVIDVKKMLSSNDRDYLVSPKYGTRVPISSLDGKYVLVCSFTRPFSNPIIQSLEALCSEPLNVPFVQIVLLLDDDVVSYPSDFHSFFHSLSFNCLTIPLSDYNSCPRIRKSLPPPGIINVSCLAVHPSGCVLQNTPEFLYTYGSLSFPFSEDNFEMIRYRELNLHFCLSNSLLPPLTLEELLSCNSLPLVAHPNYFKPTSSLYNRPVGLYLYCDGQYLRRFLYIHQQCISKGLDFEFIIVPLPFDTRHPDYFVRLMKQSVLTYCPNSSWLTFPFNDKICRTFWRLYRCDPSDQLIIMPHAGRAGELEARSIIRRYGIDSYPFTRDVIVEKKLTHLRSKTLESLLGDDHGLDICNKNVILYLVDTYVFVACDFSDDIMKRKSHKIMSLYQDTQLYALPLVPVSGNPLENLGFKVLPEEKWKSVIDHIFMTNDPLCHEMPQETVVTFGKDGKLLSRCDFDDIDDLTAASRFDYMLSSQIPVEIQRQLDADD